MVRSWAGWRYLRPPALAVFLGRGVLALILGGEQALGCLSEGCDGCPSAASPLGLVVGALSTACLLYTSDAADE